jgi:hypothetical protein
MGNTQINSDDESDTPIVTPSKEEASNLKLEAQKIKDFSGTSDDWQKWKNRTRCAFSGSGYEPILDNEEYARDHPRMNNIVYSQLAAATADGIAFHLVAEHETTSNGHLAWKNLCDWFDGDAVQSETAENLRNKIDNLKLHSGTTGGEYINKFLHYFRDLQKIPKENFSDNHAVHLFLKNITDPDYKTTVTYCKNTRATLVDCVDSVRRAEIELQQERLRRYKSKARRNVVEENDEDSEATPKRRKTQVARRTPSTNQSENEKFEGELSTTERGLLRFKGDCWKKMEDKDKEFVREYNASVKHGELEKMNIPSGITIKARVRRTQTQDKEEEDEGPSNKKRPSLRGKKKAVHFGIQDSDHDDE